MLRKGEERTHHQIISVLDFAEDVQEVYAASWTYTKREYVFADHLCLMADFILRDMKNGSSRCKASANRDDLLMTCDEHGDGHGEVVGA